MNLLRLLLVLVQRHVQLVHRVIEFGVEELVVICKADVSLLRFLLLNLVLLVNYLLLFCDVFEHILAFWKGDIVGENLRKLVVESNQLWQARLRLLVRVGTL